MNAVFLYLETAESDCTVAIFEGCVCRKVNTTLSLRDQASRLAPEVRNMMAAMGLSYYDLSAVVVHNGPGSYTGLRVSLSLAKGLCLATGVPLIAPTGHELQARTWLFTHPDFSGRLAVLTDARRNDAYASVFDQSGNVIFPAQLCTLDQDWAAQVSAGNALVLIGSGAEKCAPLLPAFPQLCIDQAPKVEAFGHFIQESFEHQRFADLVSVVPMYISPVNITKPRTFTL